MDNGKLPSDGGVRFGDLKKKWENFWYHYKIQTIIALVLIVTLVICTGQMITREVHDYCILYAGPQILAVQDIMYMKAAVEDIAVDFDGNGEVIATFDDIVMLSPEEQREAQENGAVLDPSFINMSMTEYYQQIIGGDAVICMLSPYMYGIVRDADGFLPLAEVFDEIPEAAFDEYGIRLLQTDFGRHYNGINDLPEDTVLCIRRLSTMAQFKGEAKTRKAHEANVELFKAMVGFVAPEVSGTAEPASTDSPVTVTDIIDRTEIEDLATAEALEGFYSDGQYHYFFPSIKSHYIVVLYSDGTSENINDAIAAGRVTIADLDTFEIGYYKQPITAD